MKVLVLSLLRVGDLFMHAAWMKSFLAQHSGAQLHVLMNDSSEGAVSILPFVKQFYCFQRNDLQKILVERAQHPRRALQAVENLVDDLNSENYDLVVNLTHNQLSGYLMNVITAKKYWGLRLNSEYPQAKFENLWLSYLNHHYSEKNGSRFHYVDILHRAFGISADRTHQKINDRRGILIQPLTSDPQKNWGLAQFAELKNLLQSLMPGLPIKILGAPFERTDLEECFRTEDLLICDFATAAGHLGRAELLISGDTSLIHLASLQSCPVLGLFVGYADPQKTAPWNTPVTLMRPMEQKSLSVHQVFQQTVSLLTHQPRGETSMTTAYLTQNDLLRLKKQEVSLEEILFEFESEAWTFYLDQKHLESVPPYRTTVRLFSEIYLNGPLESERQSLASHFLASSEAISAQVEKFLKLVQQLNILSTSGPEDAKGSLTEVWLQMKEWNNAFCEQWVQYRDQNQRLSRALENQPQTAFEGIRKLKGAIIEIESLAIVREKLCSELVGYLKENLSKVNSQKGLPHVGKTEVGL